MVDKTHDEAGRLALLERQTEELLTRVARVEAVVAGLSERPGSTPVEGGGEHAPRRERSRPEVGGPERLRPEGSRPGEARLRSGSPEGGSPERPGGWAPVAAAAARTAAQTPARVAPPAQRPGLEDLLAGRVLAWAGGLAVLVGIVLLFAVAMSRGWIGEGLRTLLGAVASFTLVAVGAWLHEQRGRTDAALAAVAAGLGGLFAAAVVASRLYELVPVGAGLAMALATGALATALALRWNAQGIAALGIVGGLMAPVAVGAPADGGTALVLFAATLSAVAVSVARGWRWLPFAAFAVVTPQWVAYLGDGTASTGETLACLTGFGVLGAAAAVGHSVRTRMTAGRDLPADGTRASAGADTIARLLPDAAALLGLNALVVGATGWFALDDVSGRTAADAWVAGLALAHAAMAAAVIVFAPHARRLGLASAALGVALGDVALGLALDGLPLAFAWSATAIGLAALVARLRRGDDLLVSRAALVAQVALAGLHAALVDVGPDLVAATETAPADAAPAVAAFVVTAIASSALLARDRAWRDGLFAVGLAGAAYLVALLLDGPELVAAWAAGAVLLAELGIRRRDLVATAGAVGHLACAAIHTFAFEAPVTALLDGSDDLLAAAIALTACAIAAWRCGVAAGQFRGAENAAGVPRDAAEGSAAGGAPEGAEGSGGAASHDLKPLALFAWSLCGVVALHLASVGVVTAAGAGPRAQTLLSVLWGLAGVTALIVGLVRDVAPLRAGALTLLLAALGKVFLYDLATLTPIARVASFIALGLLLLSGAFAWQRIRER